MSSALAERLCVDNNHSKTRQHMSSALADRARHLASRRASRKKPRRGTNGVRTRLLGSLQISCFLTEGLFGYQSVKICQMCVPFSNNLSKSLLLQRHHISVDPICNNIIQYKLLYQYITVYYDTL